MRVVYPQIIPLGNLPFGVQITSDCLVAIVPIRQWFKSIDSAPASHVKCAFLQDKCSFWKEDIAQARDVAYGELFSLEEEPLIREWFKCANVL